jgi:glutamate/tyrosine decarboxylase-like PLP-dependent enzyme
MPVTIASNWLATAWDQNTGLHAVTPGTSQIEVVALRWLLLSRQRVTGFGAPPVTVIVGDEVHPTVLKALGVLGMGQKRVVRVPVDSQGRMRADALPRISGPTIVCTQAGNLNTGAFDPIAEVIEHAHAGGAWVHVDGAFCLWARSAPTRAGAFAARSRRGRVGCAGNTGPQRRG